MIIGQRSHKRLVGATFRVGTECPPYGMRFDRSVGCVLQEFDGSEPGPGNNRFTRLKYVGFWNAPNKTLFPARLTDNLETVIGADQKIGEN